ncbi:hypothetical protein Tco_1346949 [Tanacetum coccineum]
MLPNTLLSCNSFDALNDDKWVAAKVESISKTSTSGMQVEEQSFTPVVDKINRIEKDLMEGKCVLIGDDDIPSNLHDIADNLNIKVQGRNKK